MKLAVVGATGLVGSKMLQILEERDFPVTELLPVASERSVGSMVEFRDKEVEVLSHEAALAKQPKIALFSAGGKTSLQMAPAYKQAGATVIDNSSAWRMQQDIPLIVPEINAAVLTPNDKIIANPNCSTIQMVLALAPLQREYGIKRLVISTYQSVTGTGVKAVQQLDNERMGIMADRAYPHPIDLNCFPHGGDFDPTGYTTEEIKLVNETRKILNAPDIQITATVVRIPVIGGHSESVNVELAKDFDLATVRTQIDAMPGVEVQDHPEHNDYPTPMHAHEKDTVFVGRIRRDHSQPNTLNLWIVSDNLRKGAATNAVQIAEYLIEMGLV